MQSMFSPGKPNLRHHRSVPEKFGKLCDSGLPDRLAGDANSHSSISNGIEPISNGIEPISNGIANNAFVTEM